MYGFMVLILLAHRHYFEHSHVPLHTWMYAMYLVVTARNTISSLNYLRKWAELAVPALG